MNDIFVVWYSKGSGWNASEPMSRDRAEAYAANLEAEGYKTRLHQRIPLRNEDFIEG
jgi:hypothetical protein